MSDSARSADGDNHAVTELEIREASIDGHIIADCPLCMDPMLLGEMWRELILEDGHDIPDCPDCNDGEGDSWADDADVKLDAAEYWAISGDLITTINPWSDSDE